MTLFFQVQASEPGASSSEQAGLCGFTYSYIESVRGGAPSFWRCQAAPEKSPHDFSEDEKKEEKKAGLRGFAAWSYAFVVAIFQVQPEAPEASGARSSKQAGIHSP